MSHEITGYLQQIYPSVPSVAFFDSNETNYHYIPDKPTRWLYRCTYECDTYPRTSQLDTTTVLSQVAVALQETGHPTTVLTNLGVTVLTDHGEGQTSSKNRATSDADPAIVSTASEEDLTRNIFRTVELAVDRRNRFPPFNMYTVSGRESRWPDVPFIIQLNQIHFHNKPRLPIAKPIIEFHPLSSDQKTPEQTLQEFLSLYAPYFVGYLGLPVLATSATQISENESHYYIFQDYDPRYKIVESVHYIHPPKGSDNEVHLTDQTARHRLTTIGPRVALAATLGSISKDQPLRIADVAKEAVSESLSKWGKTQAGPIHTKINSVRHRAATTQKWLNREQDMGRRYPDPESPPPTTPFTDQSDSSLINALNQYLSELGYSEFI